jgi:TIR domain/Tetratricopeptide repeat
LASLGRRTEALEAIERAVEIRRQLADANPAAYEPDLAASLNNLSARFSENKRGNDAFQAAEHAVKVFRHLAAANPDAYEPNLARSLNNLSLSLGELGQTERALGAVQESTELYQRLASIQPDTYAQDFAVALGDLSDRLASRGQRGSTESPSTTSHSEIPAEHTSTSSLQGTDKTGSPTRVYVCHSRADALTARRLADALRSVGVDARLDLSERSELDTWPMSLSEQIEEADAFVVLVSAESEQHPHVQREISEILKRTWKDEGTILIPIVLGDVPLPGYLQELKTLHIESNTFPDAAKLLSLLDDATTTHHIHRTAAGNERVRRRLDEVIARAEGEV